MIKVRMFGRFEIRRDDDIVEGCESRKVQELFCFLLLNRERPHPRETLATLMWGDCSTTKSRSYFRKALWQLQTALSSDEACSHLLAAGPEWIQIDPQADLWLDVALIEEIYTSLRGVAGKDLHADQAAAVQAATDLYQGDLLEGWYQDWCLYERERLQHIYLVMLDKLVSYYESRGEYESGIAFARHILRFDKARERAHRRLMRLFYLVGDRTAALRQYARCTAALQEELGVRPATQTMALYEQIRAGRLLGSASFQANRAVEPVPELLARLRLLQTFLAEFQNQVRDAIQAVDSTHADHP